MLNNLYNHVLQNQGPIKENYTYSMKLKKDVLDSFQISTIDPEKKHFTVTELCDPLTSYLKRKYPSITSIHPERKKIMDIGNLIHKNIESWIEKIDNTALVEFYFDGLLKGFNVSGKFDAKIGDSFIEFKSKVEIPKDIKEAIIKYPQDFEQVVMYAAMDPISPKINYLIFVSQNDPLKIKSFKITIRDIKEAEKFLDERINLYKEVLGGDKEPSEFGSCRYCPNNPEYCTYYQLNKCKWFTLNKKKCGVLEFIQIDEEEIIKNKLKEIIKKEGIRNTDFISINNLIWQKKYLISKSTGKEMEFESNEIKKRNQRFIEMIVFKLNKDQSKTNNIEPPLHNFVDIFKYKSRFFNLKTVEDPEGCWIPFIVFASPTIYPKFLDRPSDYKIVELGLLLAINNLREGLIFQYYPNLKNACKVFKIKYNFSIQKVQKKIKNILEYLKKPELGNLIKLDDCPFGCEKCQFKEICKNSKK